MTRRALALLLGIGWVGLIGCAATPPAERTPAPTTEPYALLTFSHAMQLLKLDDQTMDSIQEVRRLRVPPGSHTLKFRHVNAGPEGSAEHAGQETVFKLDAHEGITYHFEAKT